MDKFPEAFDRFESQVDLGSFDSYRELVVAFQWWSGKRWKGTYNQRRALKRQVKERRLHFPNRKATIRLGHSKTKRRKRFLGWRSEMFLINGLSQRRYRDVKTGRFIRKPM
jgi:hypothetical protein